MKGRLWDIFLKENDFTTDIGCQESVDLMGREINNEK